MNKKELTSLQEQLIDGIHQLHNSVNSQEAESMSDLDRDLILSQISAMSTLAYIIGFRVNLVQNTLNEETQAAEETSNE